MRVIIDGDILTFRSASVHPVNLDDAKQYLQELLVEVHETLFTDQDNTVMFVGGHGVNFRKYYEDYKANRKATIKPATLQHLNRWVAEEYPGGSYAGDCEADDRCLIEAQKCLDANENYIIVSTDKDLKQMPGTHFNPMKMEAETINEPQADFWYYMQCITGDATDGIKGIVGVGPKKAQAHLEMYAVEDYPSAVVDMWQEKDPDDWHYNLTKTWNLIYIRRHESELGIQELPGEFTND